MGQIRTFRRKVLRHQHGAKRLKFVTSTPQKFRMFRRLAQMIEKSKESKLKQAFSGLTIPFMKKAHGQKVRRGG